MRGKEPEEIHTEPVEGFLGVDVGSVSTDFVVMDVNGGLVSSLYLPTRGAPLEVLREGLALMRSRFTGGLRVLGCGATGSGRHLAGRILGADIVRNEITCQLLGARHYLDDVESIIEIGGQDSKFVSVRGGQISDFAMNKICAAGTGSFLEEQAVRMGISIVGEFADRAFAAESPGDLGSRCTVFMETEIVSAIKNGASVEDLCAGLAFSIVRNYLEKVVGNRPLGDRILLQGGTASNDAVVAAFEQVLGRKVAVHPYNRISGAIGAADAVRTSIGTGKKTIFRGLDSGAVPSLRSFRCSGCPNNCEVNLLERDGEQIYFGDTCERYTSRGSGTSSAVLLPNLATEYLKSCEAFFESTGRNGAAGPEIGIPRASLFMAHLPFWGTFFHAIGCTPVLSDNSNADTLSLGLKHLSVGVCLPMKLTAGHVNALLEKQQDDSPVGYTH
ncbi:MAG TPA: acyl-CoA dehydratase activase, partial [Candidatus Ozemobacteraceae bacterium]|nr:acyl-CoA dehydratase activase [Candidatus Ozemobacteraceae bacterium]